MTTTARTSPLDFVNHALALLGEDPVTDLAPETGSTSALAAQIYDRIVDTLLSCWPWGFATLRTQLSALAEPPPSPWLVQYNLPANTLRIISTDIPADCYRIYSEGGSSGVGARRLYSLRRGAFADVVIRPTDELFPAHFSACVIPQLAAEMAPAVTGDLQIAQYFRGMAAQALASAKCQDANEMPARAIPQEDPRNVPYDGSSTSDWFPFVA